MSYLERNPVNIFSETFLFNLIIFILFFFTVSVLTEIVRGKHQVTAKIDLNSEGVLEQATEP